MTPTHQTFAATWLAQKYYDQGRVSWDWALANAQEPYFLNSGEAPGTSGYRRSPTPDEDNVTDLNATPEFILRAPTPVPPIIRHPTPEPATPREPPSTEPSRSRTFVLSPLERDTVRLMRQYDRRHFRAYVNELTGSAQPPVTCHKGSSKGKGKMILE
jgi:hypothetical protein